MATRMNPVTKLQIKVVIGTDPKGKDQLACRSYTVSSDLADADVLSIGSKLAALQNYPVHAICRQDDATLAE
ncbi:hypothetical protein SELR_02660 [Selenomonas ruminantium subsp. lactilytica TAM6421]|uniref:DUF1659 domain-containing protein n=1 Tax=Selenomonas ruminantium subsp. lactilytica (strain NBRC 103574 / TAM6421) TaxID=927704 RepID=I0GMI7_SELRL|nr:DUF1659 domain-containing protein [Selenomonas ruminantium]BAL81974.1 hypothetical protein SELR_02660 [Selenomonas ruminantium subsp. lactilytica TAM6421]